MMRALLTFLLLFPLLCNPQSTQNFHSIIAKKKVAGPPTYLVSEDFEGAGTPTDWTTDLAAGGTVDFDYATSPAPLAGSQSCQINATTTGHINGAKTFTAQSTVEVYCMIYMDNAGAGGTASTARLLSFYGTGGTVELGTLRYNSTGSNFSIACGSTVEAGSAGSHYDTLYHVWLRYVKGTGANAVLQVYISTTDTKPGSPTITTSAGTSTEDADQIRLITPGRVHDPVIYDKVRVNPSIGSSPT